MWILSVPKEEVEKHQLEPGQRYIGKIGENVEWNLGLLTLGEGKLYIMFSEARKKKAGLPDKDTDSIELTLIPDTSKYDAPMPEEFQAILDMEPDFDRRFHAQTPGFQRTILNYIAGFKSEAKRLEHGMRLMRNIMAFPTDKFNIGTVMRQK